MTRRHGNADLWSAQPRAARRARRTSNSGMAPVSAYPQQARGGAGKGTPTSGRGSAARSAAGETNLDSGIGVPVAAPPVPTAVIPASRQYVVRPPPAGGADRRSAFWPGHPGTAASQLGGDAGEAVPNREVAGVPGLPDHPRSRRYLVVRPPPAGGDSGGLAFRRLPVGSSRADRRSTWFAPDLRRAVPTGGGGSPRRPRDSARVAMRRSLGFAQRCRSEASVEGGPTGRTGRRSGGARNRAGVWCRGTWLAATAAGSGPAGGRRVRPPPELAGARMPSAQKQWQRRSLPA